MRLTTVLLFCLIALGVSPARAQDPADGWLAYAHTSCPTGTRVTHIEAKWKVGQNPPKSMAFFSPWMGMDTTDNMNLLQPVNPWMGNSWSLYTEYYQWSPEFNRNSDSIVTLPGHVLHGTITYNGDQTYTLMQRDMNTGAYSTMQIPVQKDQNGEYKNYTIPYLVYEKVARCQQYPPDGIVTFYDIMIYCNGARITPQWLTGVVEDVCDFKANVLSPETVSITWSTSSTKQPTRQQLARSRKSSHRKRVVLSKNTKWHRELFAP